jgi:hypothetical protein
MLEAAKRAKELALRGKQESSEGELEIPSDIPKHHFELEESQEFFDLASSQPKKQSLQPPQSHPQALKPQGQVQGQTQSQIQSQPQGQPTKQPPSQQPQQNHLQQLFSNNQQSAQQSQQLPFFGAPMPQQRCWFYLDPKGNEQGPFSSAQMEKWLMAKYFTIDLEVRCQDDYQYLPLAIHFLREQRNPFTEVPLHQWLSAPALSEFQTALLQVLTTFKVTGSLGLVYTYREAKILR